MGIFDLFSKRQKKLRGEVPDVYTYDTIPNPLRVQIVHIWNDALGNYNEYIDKYLGVGEVFKFIVETLCREYGLFNLIGRGGYSDRNHMEELVNFFLKEDNNEKVVDAIELSFRCIDGVTRNFDYRNMRRSSEIADEAILELNSRFKEHGIGYQYTDGEIIRVDSELIHSEVVKPALKFLRGKFLVGAQQEYLKAHEHFRRGNTKGALNESLKAFESTMKAICDKRGWSYDQRDTSRKLIEICLENELIPSFWQQQMTSLRVLLESGVPTGRNKLSGHGQGSEPIDVPMYIAAYVIHMTAAAIVFLCEAEQKLN
jgi:Domain of unknown function (DUF7014)/AbiJ N-terminal domain 4